MDKKSSPSLVHGRLSQRYCQRQRSHRCARHQVLLLGVASTVAPPAPLAN